LSTVDRAQMLRARIEANLTVTHQLLTGDALETISRIGDVMVTALRNDGTIFFFGNGGSSAEAQHLAAEMLGRFYRDRQALPSICLSDNTAAMTAIANDYSYDETFSRQLAGLGKPGDVAVGLSTSGNSANVVRALQVAKANGLQTVVLTGAGGGLAADVAQENFRSPSTDTARIQEVHLLVGHILCEIVENELFPPDA
jgi:D-sedoheptulose 7-phosphate isomerase